MKASFTQGKQGWLLLRIVFRASVLVLALSWLAHSRLSSPATTAPVSKDATLLQRLAAKAGISESQVRTILCELGPEISIELQRGNQVNLPGLGSVQMVHIPSHERLDGKTNQVRHVPSYFDVEFQPSQRLLQELNSAGQLNLVSYQRDKVGSRSSAENNSNVRPAVLTLPGRGN